MKKIAVLVLVCFGLLAGSAFVPTEILAKSKHKSCKCKTSKTKKHRNGKKQTVDQSMDLLKQYLPEYYSLSQFVPGDYNYNQNLPQTFDENSMFTDPVLRRDLINNINEWLGTPYRHGGHSKNGVDCSNFTSAMVETTFGIKFPCSPGAQAVLFDKINDVKDLQFGDLIFFSGRNKRAKRVGHVGIYLGDGLFAHSSSGRGVIYTHISQGYYNERFRFGGRFEKANWASSVKLAMRTDTEQ